MDLDVGTIVRVTRYIDHLRNLDEKFNTDYLTAEFRGLRPYGVVVATHDDPMLRHVTFVDHPEWETFALIWLDVVSPLELLAATLDDTDLAAEFKMLEIIARRWE